MSERELNSDDAPEIDDRNLKKIISLAERFWTDAEIGAELGITADAVRRMSGEELDRARLRAKGAIRDLVYKAAFQGKRSAIAHLAKHQLGEHDQTHIKVEALSNEQLAAIIQKRLEAEATKPLQIAKVVSEIEESNE